MHVTGARGDQHGLEAAAVLFQFQTIKVAMRIDKHPETLTTDGHALRGEKRARPAGAHGTAGRDDEATLRSRYSV
ncbi:hypothetical protein CLAM6_09000 [Cobetia sp. AM6]|nr:hypothetical protein CLAM6_09000 [Cobetia sp. AM6]